MADVADAAEAAAVEDDELMRIITATAEDGQQRALDAGADSGESLEDLRQRARELIIAAPDGSEVKRVKPWLWSAQASGGQALTPAGDSLGAELRISRYATPQYGT